LKLDSGEKRGVAFSPFLVKWFDKLRFYNGSDACNCKYRGVTRKVKAKGGAFRPEYEFSIGYSIKMRVSLS